ncbi:molybdate ABC transporter substrate-binding protein [Luteolibacter pohnpeiensis]|uniref:Molybdate ABC transporter substrate-binding protein n=1 Tax=Luteolibacter pohnpeiensis TaxID=454153 RepID=A0A934S573_9BACT|nr:molybdate ABC transporter substrate-binding protein [Luteolibacter pohnpeiensis]MBK1881369.1 molybdate ABC transporter substrate-binding protein [Luteolibacter pohnpeiensis]
MKLLIRVFLAIVLLSTAQADALRISAAASLSDVMTEISKLHEKAAGGEIQLNFGGSNVLARQIEAGAPCDLFFSADEATMNGLKAKGLLLDSSITALLANRLVVIVPNESHLTMDSAETLASSKLKRLALGDPAAVPAGVYTRKWLEQQKLWGKVAPKVIALENVRGALAAVASGNVDAGVVYQTDAMISNKVRVVYKVPAEDAPEIRYPIAVCKSSSQSAAAREFIKFLQTPAAVEIFKKFGFSVTLAEP